MVVKKPLNMAVRFPWGKRGIGGRQPYGASQIPGMLPETMDPPFIFFEKVVFEAKNPSEMAEKPRIGWCFLVIHSDT